MRDKLNESKAAQIGLLAVLALVVGYMVLSNMGGGSESSAAETDGTAVESAEPVSATSAVSAPAGKKLPHSVETAYARGDTIALLVYRRGGIDDRAVKAATSVLATMPKVAFFKTPTTKIARYAAITGPLGVNGAPALIVIRGRSHKGETTAPATVTYGFQGPAEVRQAVIDADYTGPEPSYAPQLKSSPDAMPENATHLRPLPGPNAEPEVYVEQPAATAIPAAEQPSAPVAGAAPGVTRPSGYGRNANFVTDVLVAIGYVSAERVEAAVAESRLAGKPPERILLEQGAIDARQMSLAIAERYGLEHVDLSSYPVDMAAANLLPITSARRYQAIPIGYLDAETLLVAMADPANVLAADDIKMATGLRCRLAVADAADIESLLSRVNSLQSAVTEAVRDDGGDADEEGLDPLGALHASADDAPVVKLVYSILGQAVNEGVSDIHFEPEQEDMRVRFRVDGVLHEAAHVPRRMVSAVISRIKIMSDLDIAERRIPQDGRVGVTVDESRVDLRVTTLPTQRGEGATIRILDTRNAMRSLDQLGMGEQARGPFEGSVRRAYGAVLVTGPTGSGKSTTLYAALAAINSVEKNVITIEDPVEYQIDGVNQINVNPKAGLTFAAGLRSVLRADPDVLMVGEIRDAETARIAIEAALTGHLVLSTLHTNDAPGTITRLQKMGIESFLTASAIDCIVAQRLARTLCPSCKRRSVVTPQSMAEAGFQSATGIEAYEAVGCSRCGGTGYRGRVGLYSVMRMTERLKDMTVNHASQAEISGVARQEGMATLREDGLDKARSGLTSFDEVVRVTT